MYYTINDYIYPKSVVTTTLQHLLELDGSNSHLSPSLGSNEDVHNQPRKRRKVACRILKLTPDVLCNALNIKHIKTATETSSSNRSLYSIFTQQLITDGFIAWRHHSENQETVVLNDYNTATGILLPLSYVHVNCIDTNQSGYILTCSCSMYETHEKVLLYLTSPHLNMTILFWTMNHLHVCTADFTKIIFTN